MKRVRDVKAQQINTVTPKNDPPKNWKDVYQLIKEYRKMNLAPVDTMGCDKSLPRLKDKDKRFTILLSLILSSQTKDEYTHASILKLAQFNDNYISAELINKMSDSDIHRCIDKVGFHNKKINFIKSAAKRSIEKYDGDIPDNLPELLQFEGVGPKMAYLALQCGWEKNIGIGVDTHVHRISNRLGWCNTKDPEKTRKELEEWLPREYWREINHLLVGFGQTKCYSVNPDCASCPVSELCPSKQLRNKISKTSSKAGKSIMKIHE